MEFRSQMFSIRDLQIHVRVKKNITEFSNYQDIQIN